MTFAIELNNIGVSFLRSGNLDEAFESFKLAVELMKQTTAKRERRFVRRRSVTQPASVLRAKYELGLIESRVDKDSEPNSACFVSKAAIMLPESMEAGNDSWESAILIFNLALALHLIGLEPGMESFLHKGLKLYKLAKKLITQHLKEDEQDQPEESELNRINTQLVMSILNNMGHIYYELGEFVASRTYFDGMTTMVAWNARQQLGYQDLEAFLLNSIVLSQPSVAAAA
jgi:tetratricopeptide (TPR) repeat protein